MKKRLEIFGKLFFLVAAFDLLKSIVLGGATIVNWHSFVHAGWVTVAILMIFAAAKFEARFFRRLLFVMYFLVFLTALLNQYLFFSDILNYNCMLFNLVLTAVFFFAY